MENSFVAFLGFDFLTLLFFFLLFCNSDFFLKNSLLNVCTAIAIVIFQLDLFLFTVHVVRHGSGHGRRRVGGPGLRRRRHRVVHDDQHVAAALVGVGVRRQRARLQLAAQGDLAAHRGTHRQTRVL